MGAASSRNAACQVASSGAGMLKVARRSSSSWRPMGGEQEEGALVHSWFRLGSWVREVKGVFRGVEGAISGEHVTTGPLLSCDRVQA